MEMTAHHVLNTSNEVNHVDLQSVEGQPAHFHLGLGLPEHFCSIATNDFSPSSASSYHCTSAQWLISILSRTSGYTSRSSPLYMVFERPFYLSGKVHTDSGQRDWTVFQHFHTVCCVICEEQFPFRSVFPRNTPMLVPTTRTSPPRTKRFVSFMEPTNQSTSSDVYYVNECNEPV